MPSISVLLPVYNAFHELPRAVYSLLNQTYKDFEIIAIDDGSTDGSGELLDTFSRMDQRVHVFHQANAGGLGKVLNRAAELANGQYLARQDADDASHHERLEKQIQYMDSHQNIGLCGSWSWFIDASLGPLFSLELPDNHDLLTNYLEKGKNPFVHGSTMFRKDIFQRLGGYRGSYAEDYELWLRMSEVTQLGTCTRLGYYYWRSIGGISAGAHTRQVSLIQLYLHLKNERERLGKEITNWELEYKKIIDQPNTETNIEERNSAMHYARAIQLLRRRLYKASKAEFIIAAEGSGGYAKKAQRNLILFQFAPFLANIYHFLERREPFYYAQTLPPGSEIPEDLIHPGIKTSEV